MEVKVNFETLGKEFFTDFSNIEVERDEIYIRQVDFDFFAKEELTKLSNNCGIKISQYQKNDKVFLSLYIHKSLCSVQFIEENENLNKVKYLSSKIDELSSELDKLING